MIIKADSVLSLMTKLMTPDVLEKNLNVSNNKNDIIYVFKCHEFISDY